MSTQCQVNLDIEPVIRFDSEGIWCEIFIDSKQSPLLTVFESWEKLFEREIQNQSDEEGLIIVEDEFDGVKYLNDLTDSLKNASDLLEEQVRQSHILLFNKFIEGINLENATVSFNDYMKGDYD